MPLFKHTLRKTQQGNSTVLGSSLCCSVLRGITGDHNIPFVVKLLAATVTCLLPLRFSEVGWPFPFPSLVCIIAKIARGCTYIFCVLIAPRCASAACCCVHALAGGIFYRERERVKTIKYRHCLDWSELWPEHTGCPSTAVFRRLLYSQDRSQVWFVSQHKNTSPSYFP